MKNKSNPIAYAIKIAIYASTIASLSMSGVLYAQNEGKDEDEDVVEIEKQEVTGTHIKRSYMEGALPVTIISREQIELSGENSAADLIRNLTFNSLGSFRPQSGSSAQGVSTVSLRGLGASRTLVLIDGRRLPKSPATGSSQDLNTIPLGAIERIEILSDGASAIYGSDAIGGVINIITRTDYSGFEIMLGGAEVSIPENGGERQEGSILFGSSNDTTNVIAGISWNNREIIFARDLPWNEQGASIYGNSFTTIDGNGNDNFNWRTLGDCDFPNTGYFQLGQRCAYDYNLVAADEASTGNKSMYVKARHDISEKWKVWANSSFSQTKSFGRYAPVPDSSFFSTPLTSNSPNNPTNQSSPLYNPDLGLSPQSVNWWHRFDALGNRDSNTTTELLDLTLGITGSFGNTEIEAGIRNTKNRTNTIGRNYLLRSAAQINIESGAYNLNDPYNAPDDILNSMRVTIFRDGKYDQSEIFGSLSFDLFELNNGFVAGYIGAEHRKDKYADIYDPLSEAGLVGGSAGNTAGGNRTVNSAYFEVLAPLLENLELNLAGRFDDYSDFGNNFSPKISLRYQPLDELTIRTSYGEGFRAPTLDILTQKPTFSATSVRDEQSCINQGQVPSCSLQITDIIQRNAELEAENSKQFSIGLAYEPLDWMNFTLDYYNIEISNRIRSFSAQFTIISENAGDPVPAGISCERAANGSIIRCFSGFGNQGVVNNSGVDLSVNFNHSFEDIILASNLQVSKLINYSVDDGRNFVGDPGVPEMRIGINNTATYGNWSFAYNLNLVDGTFNEIDDGIGVGHVPTWVTHDVQVNYLGDWNGKITFGIRNIGEKSPPIGLGSPGVRPYDFNLYDGYGRISYLRYTQTF